MASGDPDGARAYARLPGRYIAVLHGGEHGNVPVFQGV